MNTEEVNSSTSCNPADCIGTKHLYPFKWKLLATLRSAYWISLKSWWRKSGIRYLIPVKISKKFLRMIDVSYDVNQSPQVIDQKKWKIIYHGPWSQCVEENSYWVTLFYANNKIVIKSRTIGRWEKIREWDVHKTEEMKGHRQDLVKRWK